MAWSKSYTREYMKIYMREWRALRKRRREQNALLRREALRQSIARNADQRTT